MRIAAVIDARFSLERSALSIDTRVDGLPMEWLAAARIDVSPMEEAAGGA